MSLAFATGLAARIGDERVSTHKVLPEGRQARDNGTANRSPICVKAEGSTVFTVCNGRTWWSVAPEDGGPCRPPWSCRCRNRLRHGDWPGNCLWYGDWLRHGDWLWYRNRLRHGRWRKTATRFRRSTSCLIDLSCHRTDGRRAKPTGTGRANAPVHDVVSIRGVTTTTDVSVFMSQQLGDRRGCVGKRYFVHARVKSSIPAESSDPCATNGGRPSEVFCMKQVNDIAWKVLLSYIIRE